MPKHYDWREDRESMAIAIELVKSKPKLAHLDLRKICFIRMERKSRCACKLYANKFPYDINSDFAYLAQIFNSQWSKLAKRKRIDHVMKMLSSIPIGGASPESFD